LLAATGYFACGSLEVTVYFVGSGGAARTNENDSHFQNAAGETRPGCGQPSTPAA
jgi:hypothetical protein